MEKGQKQVSPFFYVMGYCNQYEKITLHISTSYIRNNEFFQIH